MHSRIRCSSADRSPWLITITDDAGPRFVLAMSFNVGTSCMSVIGATILLFILKRGNKKLEAGATIGPDGKLTMPRIGDLEHHDNTDKGFRFLL